MVFSGEDNPDPSKMRYFILLAILGAAMAVPRNPQRIVGGEPTTVDQWPYMANMQYGWFGIWWFQACGGALINERTILSASHCYHGDAPSSWKVILGTSYASSGGTEFSVNRLSLHENYNANTLVNDVALVHLSSSAPLSNTIGVARIAGANYNLADGTPLTVIGWGTLSSGGSSPEQLQKVEILQINQEYCAAQYAYLKSLPGYQSWPDITDDMLCAGVEGGGKDACQGDSGGPLTHDGDIVVGVVSWGHGCAHADYPGVNARVSYFSDWIVERA